MFHTFCLLLLRPGFELSNVSLFRRVAVQVRLGIVQCWHFRPVASQVGRAIEQGCTNGCRRGSQGCSRVPKDVTGGSKGYPTVCQRVLEGFRMGPNDFNLFQPQLYIRNPGENLRKTQGTSRQHVWETWQSPQTT